MTNKGRVLSGATALAVGLTVVWLRAETMRDLPYVTRWWQMRGRPEITVIETPGVCIYLYRETMAVIPKTQLPRSTGCGGEQE